MVTNLDIKNHSTSASPCFSHLNNASLSNSAKQKSFPKSETNFPFYFPLDHYSSPHVEKMQMTKIHPKTNKTAIL